MSDSEFYLKHDADTDLFNGTVHVNRVVEIGHLRRERLLLLAESFREVEKQEAAK